MEPTKLRPHDWENLFYSSPVIAGAEYREDELPQAQWPWPKGTFLQKRLKQLRDREVEHG